MTAIFLAFLICILSSVARVFLKKGLVDSNVNTGMIFSLYVGWFVLCVLFLIEQISAPFPSLNGILFFCGIGLVAPPIVRYLTYVGVDKLGAASSDQIRSLTPFFGLVFADMFLKEHVSLRSYMAGFLIFIGLFILNMSYATKDHSQESKAQFKKFFWYPLIAAVLAGIVANLRKMGGQQEITSTAGAFFAATSAMIVYSIYNYTSKKHLTIQFNKSTAKFFIFSAALTSLTDILDIYILKQSKVSYILPILSTTPLFVLLVSALFLKKYETINRYTILSAVVIFTGVQLIIMQNI